MYYWVLTVDVGVHFESLGFERVSDVGGLYEPCPECEFGFAEGEWKAGDVLDSDGGTAESHFWMGNGKGLGEMLVGTGW